jgi:SAM-dependent methyltransferase
LLDAWHAAQRGERAFHCADDGYKAVRRKFEQQKRNQYGALMMIDADAVQDKRVLDIGCGPASLLLSYQGHYADGSVALDPLTFDEHDESSYAEAGITRHIGPAEEYADEKKFDEVWLYNCLQHVQSPEQVCNVAKEHTMGAVRIFEYVAVPTDQLHLHTLMPNQIRQFFSAMNCYSECSGTINLNSSHGVSFYAACFLHRSIDPEHWR